MVFNETESSFCDYLLSDSFSSGQVVCTETESIFKCLPIVNPSFSAPGSHLSYDQAEVMGNFEADFQLQDMDLIEFDVNSYGGGNDHSAWVNTDPTTDNPLSYKTHRHQTQLMFACDSPPMDDESLRSCSPLMEDTFLDTGTATDQAQGAASSSTSTTRSRWMKNLLPGYTCSTMSSAAATTVKSKGSRRLPIAFKYKGVSARGGKWTSETRIMKMRCNGDTKLKKVWLGTYETPAQAARALDVGKFFFCAKKNKKFFDPRSKTILERLFSHLVEQGLQDLVQSVKKLAKCYGVYGTLGLQNLVI